MKKYSVPLIFLLSTSLIFLSCDNTTEPKENKFNVEIALSGAIQKGPFLNGTSVQITELENDLTPTGRNFSSQIENNAGIFQLPTIQYSSQYVELMANGYYYNEVVGSASTSPLTLYALSDITNRTSVNVNLFTTLERPRIKYLLSQNWDFGDAKDSVYNEILGVFNFPLDSIANPEDLNISLGGEENAKLLAISLILQGNRTEAELSELISNISFDLQEDGQISSSSIISDLYKGANALNLITIRENLEKRYNDLGLNAVISNFEEYLNNFIRQQDSMYVTLERNISCDGDSTSSIDIIITGGQPPYQYLWSNGSTTEDIDNIGPGNYSVTVTDSYDLIKTVTDIVIPEKIVLTADVSHIDNQNTEGAIDLSINGGESPYSFEWSNGSTSEDLSGLQVGEYSVTVTDLNGCQELLVIDVIDLDIVVIVEKNVSCDGEALSSIGISVTGGKPPYQYSWSNGSTTEDIDNIGPGNYSVTITDSYSLTKSVSDIIIPEKIVLSANVSHIDDQNTEGAIDLSVNGGEPPYSYTWSNGSDTEDLSGLQAGEYTIEVIDNNDCQHSWTTDVFDLRDITDIDGNIYSIVKINNQIWLNENLKVTHYRNGDLIPNITDDIEWANLSTGAYCYYNNDVDIKDIYGNLYNWYSVNDSRNIAPIGWHVPSDDEWQTLVDYLGGNDVAGCKMKETGTEHWASPNTGATNESGFSALPGGYRLGDGLYGGMGSSAYFWSSTQDRSSHAWSRELSYNGSEVNRSGDDKRSGFSVRCGRD